MATQTDTEATGTTDETNDVVGVADATDAELEAYIAEHSDKEVSDELDLPSDEISEGEETPEQPAKERPTEEPKPEQKPLDAKPPQETPEEREARTQALIAKQRKQLEDSEAFAKRRSNELGEVRKQLKEANERLRQGLDDKYVESPAQAMDDHAAIQANAAQIQKIEAEEATLAHSIRTQKVLSHFIKPEEMPSFDDMAKSLVADGMDEDYANQFKANPYLSMYPETLVQLAKRTAVENALRQVVQFTRDVLTENERLKGQVKTRPDAVLKSVEAAFKKGPAMTGANGGSADGSGAPSGDVSTWSDAQLEEFLSSVK